MRGKKEADRKYYQIKSFFVVHREKSAENSKNKKYLRFLSFSQHEQKNIFINEMCTIEKALVSIYVRNNIEFRSGKSRLSFGFS